MTQSKRSLSAAPMVGGPSRMRLKESISVGKRCSKSSSLKNTKLPIDNGVTIEKRPSKKNIEVAASPISPKSSERRLAKAKGRRREACKSQGTKNTVAAKRKTVLARKKRKPLKVSNKVRRKQKMQKPLKKTAKQESATFPMTEEECILALAAQLQEDEKTKAEETKTNWQVRVLDYPTQLDTMKDEITSMELSDSDELDSDAEPCTLPESVIAILHRNPQKDEPFKVLAITDNEDDQRKIEQMARIIRFDENNELKKKKEEEQRRQLYEQIKEVMLEVDNEEIEKAKKRSMKRSNSKKKSQRGRSASASAGTSRKRSVSRDRRSRSKSVKRGRRPASAKRR